MQRLVVALVLAFCAVPASAEPEAAQPRVEYQQWKGPSGFWTSPYPAKNGAYRYRLLGIGCGLVLVTGLVTLRLVKKAKAFRAAAAADKTVEP
jgi:hypothetical protein